MKKVYLLAFLSILNFSVSALVINEILYDPSGGDSGYEWIELYNESSQAVNLEGWILQKAGSSFTTFYTFPNYNLPSNQFILLAETSVENADLYSDLGMQNGGSSTDGVRLLSPDSLYSDTVVYDSPNDNNLPSDLYIPAIYFAPDVSSGNSLARISDGSDSNNCEQDFFECLEPTPKSTNIYPIDLALSHPELISNGDTHTFSTHILNLSTIDVDNSEASLEISINNQLWQSFELPFLPALDSIYFNIEIPELNSGINATYYYLNYIYDSNLENNIYSSSILIGSSVLVINEVMFKPSSEETEWIELFNNCECEYLVDNFWISDNSSGQIAFEGNIPPQGYLIISQDRDIFLETYPQVESASVMEAESWTALNNSDEMLTLYDSFGTLLEAMSYSGDNAEESVSLERINPDLPAEPDNWGYCINGSTPSEQNSLFLTYTPTTTKLSFQPNPFSPYAGQHCIISFDLPENLSRVNLKVFDLKGREVIKISDQSLQTAVGQFIWDGKDANDKLLPVGIYIVLMEAGALESEKIYRKQKTVVIAR